MAASVHPLPPATTGPAATGPAASAPDPAPTPTLLDAARLARRGAAAAPDRRPLAPTTGSGPSEVRLLLRGPLTAAVEPFAPTDEATLDAVDPAAVLAGLIDLRGGVDLAERLAAIDAPLPEREPSDPAVIRATLHAGLAEIESRFDDAFTHAFRPRYRLPDPRRGWLIIERAGLPTTPRPGPRSRKTPRPLAVATRHLWAPFGEFIETHLKRARFGLRDLRGELEPLLEGLGPDAARLVRLDQALGEATRGATEQLVRRVTYAVERAFAQRIADEFRGWPDDVGRDHFAPGFAPDGWLGELLARAGALSRAVVHHERSRLESLVESACGLAEGR